MYLYDMTKDSILIENENYHHYDSADAQDEIVIKEVIDDNHLTLYAFIRKDMIMDKFYSSVMGIVLIIIIIIIITIIGTIYYSRTMTDPLHELYLCMKSVGHGDFSPSYPRTHYKELSYLIRRFETMVNEVDYLITTVTRQERETVEAKFQALQAKINPHFLYNTLDVIRGIALAYDHRDISDMTLSLSRLFRYNVGDLKETNSLGTEIEYLWDYLKIQDYRFGDRITTVFDIKDKYKEIQITRFILQPIVENAFKYGLELKGRGAVLKIAATHNNRFLTISIHDNGPGVSPEILQKLQHSFSLEPDMKSVTKAHGLNNVNMRMKLLYGNKYGLKIDSVQGEWTRLDILIPYNKKEIKEETDD